MKEQIKEPEDLELEIYNEEQKWWVNVRDNCEETIKQFENSIKLQEAIKEMSIKKIEEAKTISSKKDTE